MCEMVAGWRAAVCDGHINAMQLLYSLTSRGDNVLTWLTRRRRWLFGVVSVSDVRVVRLFVQAKQIRGSDAVFSKLYSEILAMVHCLRAPLSVDAMAQFACTVGGVAQMRSLAAEFHALFLGNSRTALRYLASLVASLDRMQSMECQRLLAVAMALHARLGAGSPLACIGRDLLPHCVSRSIQEPLLGWRDVV